MAIISIFSFKNRKRPLTIIQSASQPPFAFLIMQGIGSTIPSTSSRQHDDARLTQTFEDSDTDSLVWDTLSEEFPLSIGPLSSAEELELDSSRSCAARIDKQTVPHSINTSEVKTKRHNCKEKSSGRVRHAPKKYTPNSNKNKVYCCCQNEDSGWYLKCDYVFPGVYNTIM